MFTNNVKLQFGSHSAFYQRDIQIPFSCRFQPGLNGAAVEDDSDSDSFVDPTERRAGSILDSEAMEEMYSMQVTSEKNGILVRKREESADIALGDTLLVETDFETRSFLHLAIERCWLSGQPAADVGKVGKQQMLIWEGCPAQTTVNVTMYPTANPSFSFPVTEDLAGRELYVFCLIGLCSPDAKLASGNLGMCVDPVEECRPGGSAATASSGGVHQSPVAQQLIRRGPLQVYPFLKDASVMDQLEIIEERDFNDGKRYYATDFEGLNAGGGVSEGEDDDDGASPGMHSSHVVMVGVPKEIAVAIALASFVIGAVLTGLLCCVHHRKLEMKNVSLNL